jgi:hypothetical protein
LKLALVQSKVETHEDVEFLRKSSLYAGAKDLENNIPVERRLCGVRVCVCVFQVSGVFVCVGICQVREQNCLCTVSKCRSKCACMHVCVCAFLPDVWVYRVE